MRVFFTSLAVAGLLSTGASAATIVFEFDTAGQSGAALDDLHTGTTTVGGVVMTAVADSASGSTFNQTASNGFGINHADSGDSTTAIDGGSGNSEFMTFSFDSDGTFTSLDIDRYTSGASDTLDVEFSGGSTLSFTAGTDSNPLAINTSFIAGQDITIRYTGGNGFGIESITIDAIPEPTGLAPIVGLGGLLLAFRRRR